MKEENQVSNDFLEDDSSNLGHNFIGEKKTKEFNELKGIINNIIANLGKDDKALMDKKFELM